MSRSRYSPNMSIMVKAAEKASRGLIRDFGEVENLQVSRKGPNDFVTAADLRSEKIIREELEYARPGYSFLMEESGKVEGKDTDHKWIIDPLDGTKNFMHGFPHWSITIALEEKGEVICGLIYDPVRDEMFWAEKGIGAFMNSKRLRVSSRNNMADAMVGMGSPTRGKKGHDMLVSEIPNIIHNTSTIRRAGSAALDLAYVAAGRLECYWERGLSPWDSAAGILLIKEAGGFVTDLDDAKNPVYGKALAASNSALHTDFIKLLKMDNNKVKTA